MPGIEDNLKLYPREYVELRRIYAEPIIAVLMSCQLPQALTAPPNIPGFADQAIPGLQLAIATGASVYFLRENKKAGLGAALNVHT